jgi:putative ABC transport system substrate-binding protein
MQNSVPTTAHFERARHSHRAKRLELLKELIPQLTQAAVILNADNPAAEPEFQKMETSARSLNIRLQPFRLRTPSELVTAFEAMEQVHVPLLSRA